MVVGRGWTQPGGRPHAETEALKRAGKAAQGATLYVTLEPCSHQGKTPPCVDAIIRAGIARVVSALEDPNPEVAGQGYAKLRERGIAVDDRPRRGGGGASARRTHPPHARRPPAGAAEARGVVRRQGRRCPDASPPASPASRRARASTRCAPRADAILVGIGTVLSDDPHLTCRLPGMIERSPVRVILDARLRVPLATSIIGTAREMPTWVFTDAERLAPWPRTF